MTQRTGLPETEDRDGFSLAQRPGLPDALRVLVADYPAEAWEAHPHLSELARFWLERHLVFRRMQAMMLADTRGFIEKASDPEAYSRRLIRLASGFLDDLHGHHTIEDLHFFPRLQRLDPRVATGFDLLEGDHQEIDPLLHGLAERGNAVLAAIRHGRPTADAAGALEAELVRLEGFLDRHLTDEEELVVPLLLAHPDAVD